MVGTTLRTGIGLFHKRKKKSTTPTPVVMTSVPSDFGTLIGWYDPTTPATVTAATGVSQINDRSTAVAHLVQKLRSPVLVSQ